MSLSNSIVNADISTIAAIAYSKLSLATSIQASDQNSLAATSTQPLFADGLGKATYRSIVAGDLPSLSGLYATTQLNNLSAVALNTSLLFGLDGTNNIGASGANRPANIYASSTIKGQQLVADNGVSGADILDLFNSGSLVQNVRQKGYSIYSNIADNTVTQSQPGSQPSVWRFNAAFPTTVSGHPPYLGLSIYAHCDSSSDNSGVVRLIDSRIAQTANTQTGGMIGIQGTVSVTTTGNDLYNLFGNFGVAGAADANYLIHTGLAVGVIGQAQYATAAIGGYFDNPYEATYTQNAKYFGVIGLAFNNAAGSNNIGGYFALKTGRDLGPNAIPSLPSINAGILVDNVTQTSVDLAVFQSGGVSVTRINGSGNILSAVDGGINIGALGTNRPKTIYLSGGVAVSESANGKQGTIALVAGTATVSNTSVTATSRIFLTAQSLGTVVIPQALAVTARTAGTSFTITSQSATDTSTIAYEIFEVA